MTDLPPGGRAAVAVPTWNRFTTWLALSAYWLVVYLSSRVQALVGARTGDGVPVIAGAFFGLIILCMLTERGDWSHLKRAAFVPASLAAHAILTVPMAAALGILVYEPDRVRSAAEQKAVFVLASVPVLAYAMWRSRLFVNIRDPGPERINNRRTEPTE